MNIHWLQHVPFEGLGCIEPWLVENGHEVSCIRLWAGDPLPQISNQLVGQGCHSLRSLLSERKSRCASLYSESLSSSTKQEHTRSQIREACPTTLADIDGLIVMGGPMGVTDEEKYPWLAEEKAFIKAVIDQNKPVLGICLGAQLIAEVLGADVRPAKNKEIGFFECRASVPLASNDRDGRSTLFSEKFVPFHWHGDTFGIPNGAVHLASSEATENQAFIYKNNVLALQFHLETTEASLLALYENAQDEIVDGPFIQPLEKMREFFPMLGNCNELMCNVLLHLFGETQTVRQVPGDFP